MANTRNAVTWEFVSIATQTHTQQPYRHKTFSDSNISLGRERAINITVDRLDTAVQPTLTKTVSYSVPVKPGAANIGDRHVVGLSCSVDVWAHCGRNLVIITSPLDYLNVCINMKNYTSEWLNGGST